MKYFKTLRGFIEGKESDEPIYFANSASLRIYGQELNFEEIEQHLRIKASRTHRTGVSRGPRDPGPGHHHDMWSFWPSISEERPLEEHIDALWSTIQHAEAYLLDLKQQATVDVFLGYRSNCDHCGIDVPHTSLMMFTRLEIPFSLSIIVV